MKLYASMESMEVGKYGCAVDVTIATVLLIPVCQESFKCRLPWAVEEVSKAFTDLSLQTGYLVYMNQCQSIVHSARTVFSST